MKSLSPLHDAKRVVVLAPQGLGDALEATPLVAELKKAADGAELVVVTMRPQVKDLFESLSEIVDRVEYIPFWEKGPRAALVHALRLLLTTRADATFLAYPAARPEYSLLAALVPSKTRFAHAYPIPRFIRPLVGKTTHVAIAKKHNVLRNLDLLAAAGVVSSPPDSYVVPKSWLAERTHPRRILLHVGSIVHHGLENRRWPSSSFVALGRELKRRSFEVACISGPAERAITSRIAHDLDDARIIEGPLPAVAREIAASAALIANDNGIAHVAAGVHTPVIALMGPTPIEHGPFGRQAIAYRPTICPPCFDVATTDSRCALGIDYACLKNDIRVAGVIEALEPLLAGARSTSDE